MKIAPDKIKHLVIWYLGTLILNFLLYFKLDMWQDVLKVYVYSSSIAFGLGVVKEVYDCNKLKTTRIVWLDNILRPLGLIGVSTGFSFWDLVADFVGIVLADITFAWMISITI